MKPPTRTLLSMMTEIGSGPIEALSDTDLLLEWNYWDKKIANATSWGAAVAAAHEFRQICQREIDKRNRGAAGGTRRA